MSNPADEEIRARIFISCGQGRGSDEERIARQIESRLIQLGFDPYVAIAEQTLRGLKDNIFARLRESEYFIFVDFTRERIGETDPPVYRGSLFTHQELAIASFLELDVLAFQETGVKRDNGGVIQFLQTNAISFTDRENLHSVVADNVRRRGWDTHWRNELVLERSSSQASDARRANDGLIGRYYHIDVVNRHKLKMATNCYVYLEKVVDLKSGRSLPIKTAEFKWAGTMLPNVGIAAGNRRPFDAFFILHHSPTVLQFNSFADSTEFVPRVSGEGQYELTYLVTSDGFTAARGTFVLDLKSRLVDTVFSVAPP